MTERLYTIKREDYFKIPSREKYMLSTAGSLWISMWLTDAEVFALWCQGIVAVPFTG